MQRRHNDTMKDGGVCYADLCDITRCPYWAQDTRLHSKKRGCMKAEVDQRRFECQNMLRECLTDSPGLPVPNSSRLVLETLNTTLCAPVSCDYRRRCYGDGGGTDSDCDPPPKVKK